MLQRTRTYAGFAAVLLALLVASTAAGYTGQVAGSVTIAVRGNVDCAAPFTVAATVVDANGTPLSGESVAWSFVTSPSDSDSINATPTTSDSNGVATTSVTLAAVAGTRRVRATTGDVSATVVLSPACEGGLPNTSTDPTESDLSPTVPILVTVLAVLCAAGYVLARRRVASSR